MSSSDDDDSPDDFTDAEWKKIQLIGCKAEQQILETFITHVPAPSLAQCEEAIKWKDTTGFSVEILALFGHEEHAALKDMWENCFSKDVVRSYAGMGDDKCIMFQYAVNRIFRKLVYENKEYAKNKRIRYKWYTEVIDAASVLCLVNKTEICPVWNL